MVSVKLNSQRRFADMTGAHQLYARRLINLSVQSLRVPGMQCPCVSFLRRVFSCDSASAPFAPPHLPVVDRLASTNCFFIDFAKSGEYKAMNEADREKACAPVEGKIEATEGGDENREMRRQLMKRIAMGGFVAPLCFQRFSPRRPPSP